MIVFTSKGPDPETKKGIDEIKNELRTARESQKRWKWITFGVSLLGMIVGILGFLVY